MDIDAITKLIFEYGSLRRIQNAGLATLGIRDVESVAEHSLRAAQIGYVLACMEGYDDPQRICTMMVFHDSAESRTGDVHKIGSMYVQRDEKRAMHDQLQGLGSHGDTLADLYDDFSDQTSKAAIIAKDADWLERAFTAREFSANGYTGADIYIEKVQAAVRTESAKLLVQRLQEIEPVDWWNKLRDDVRPE